MMMLNHFANPQAAWLLLLPLVVYFMFPAIKKTYGDALKVPFLADIKQIQSVSGQGMSFKPAVFSAIKIFLFALVWVLMVLALCRPQWVGKPIPVKN